MGDSPNAMPNSFVHSLTRCKNQCAHQTVWPHHLARPWEPVAINISTQNDDRSCSFSKTSARIAARSALFCPHRPPPSVRCISKLCKKLAKLESSWNQWISPALLVRKCCLLMTLSARIKSDIHALRTDLALTCFQWNFRVAWIAWMNFEYAMPLVQHVTKPSPTNLAAETDRDWDFPSSASSESSDPLGQSGEINLVPPFPRHYWLDVSKEFFVPLRCMRKWIIVINDDCRSRICRGSVDLSDLHWRLCLDAVIQNGQDTMAACRHMCNNMSQKRFQHSGQLFQGGAGNATNPVFHLFASILSTSSKCFCG